VDLTLAELVVKFDEDTGGALSDFADSDTGEQADFLRLAREIVRKAQA
jgi:hypothetical protein